MANGLFGGGDGTETNPYLVEDAADLDAVRNNLSSHFVQTADIDLSQWGNWNPIGYGYPIFVGNYDGKDYEIKNMFIDGSLLDDPSYLGLFYGIEENEIKNIKLVNYNIINANEYCGGLVGEGYDSSILNCHVQGTINPAIYTCGGLMGDSYGCKFSRCSANVQIGDDQNQPATNGSYGGHGGLIGSAFEGFVGDNLRTEIEQCFAVGSVAGNFDMGGLIGLCSDTTIRNSYSNVNIIAPEGIQNENLGGIVGDASATNVINSYAVGFIPNGVEISGIIPDVTDFSGVSNTVENSYYSIEKTNQNNAGLGTPKPDAEMMKKETFENWDFLDIWGIEENKSYPYFKVIVNCIGLTLSTLKVNIIN